MPPQPATSDTSQPEPTILHSSSTIQAESPATDSASMENTTPSSETAINAPTETPDEVTAESCPICYEPFQLACKTVPCEHTFCFPCIARVITDKYQKRHTSPAPQRRREIVIRAGDQPPMRIALPEDQAAIRHVRAPGGRRRNRSRVDDREGTAVDGGDYGGEGEEGADDQELGRDQNQGTDPVEDIREEVSPAPVEELQTVVDGIERVTIEDGVESEETVTEELERQENQESNAEEVVSPASGEEENGTLDSPNLSNASPEVTGGNLPAREVTNDGDPVFSIENAFRIFGSIRMPAAEQARLLRDHVRMIYHSSINSQYQTSRTGRVLQPEESLVGVNSYPLWNFLAHSLFALERRISISFRSTGNRITDQVRHGVENLTAAVIILQGNLHWEEGIPDLAQIIGEYVKSLDEDFRAVLVDDIMPIGETRLVRLSTGLIIREEILREVREQFERGIPPQPEVEDEEDGEPSLADRVRGNLLLAPRNHRQMYEEEQADLVRLVAMEEQARMRAERLAMLEQQERELGTYGTYDGPTLLQEYSRRVARGLGRPQEWLGGNTMSRVDLVKQLASGKLPRGLLRNLKVPCPMCRTKITKLKKGEKET